MTDFTRRSYGSPKKIWVVSMVVRGFNGTLNKAAAS
jgi:hypothetical protein